MKLPRYAFILVTIFGTYYSFFGSGDTLRSDNEVLEQICAEFSCVEPMQPSPEQVIVSPHNSQWLSYASGKSFFLAGAGDPEDFLYRGARNTDGTRDGDQEQLIRKLSSFGANGMYFQMVRSHGGDGSQDHNPFIDSDPGKGLDVELLDQWDKWFTLMGKLKIAMLVFFYDDSSRVWQKRGDGLSQVEINFIREIVWRFKHHSHVIWGIAEEYQEAYTAQEIVEFAAHIRSVDEFRHPIAVHKLKGLDFSEFKFSRLINQYAIQYADVPANEYNAALNVEWVNANSVVSPYNLNMSESPGDWTATQGRLKSWASAMAGAYVMIYKMDIATTADEDIQMLGYLRSFMESIPLVYASPNNQLAEGATQYVLDVSNHGIILYTSNIGRLGVRHLSVGDYKLNWFNPLNGKRVIELLSVVDGGIHYFERPDLIGDEVALYLERVKSK